MSHPHRLSPPRWAARIWMILALLVAIGTACAQSPAERPAAGAGGPGVTAPRREPANVMPWEKADWLEREGRAETEKPELVLQAMELKPGMTVAEIGAGTGFFSRRIAKVVGPTGKVYAEDIQPQMLDLLKERTAREGVQNVIPVLGTETDPKLPRRGVDRVLLVDVYHEFQKPEPMLAAIRSCLAPGGTVTLVEYRLEGDTASHINIKHRMSVEQVLQEWTAAGFTLVRRNEDLPSQHVFIFSARRGARPPA
jgi:ubiquinone/menaquinone biosynthesis C-methylase UbiE